MEREPIETAISNGAFPAISRDQVRAWVVQEKSRGKRRRAIGVGFAVTGFLAIMIGQWVLLNREAIRVRRIVDRQPSQVVENFRGMTEDLIHEPPAEYFLRQLTIRGFPRRANVLNNQ